MPSTNIQQEMDAEQYKKNWKEGDRGAHVIRRFEMRLSISLLYVYMFLLDI